MNNQELNGRNVLITGSTSGIGSQIAAACIQRGASVIFTGRSQEKLLELKNTYGNYHYYVKADLNEDNGIEELASNCPELHGIVHCAGIIKIVPVNFITRFDIEKIMNTNFFSSVILTTSLLKKKKITKQSSIVFISSITGNYSAMKGNAMYSASKGAMNAFAKVLALELSSKKIRVNTINPGMVKTKLWQNETSEISTDQILEDEKKYPLGYGEPSDVAEAAVFLLSSKSKWITGSNIVLDGGFTIQ